MLSAIGRAAVRRVVVRGPQSSNRAFASTWLPQHVGSFHYPKHSSIQREIYFSLGRSYATATKPKATSKTASPKEKAAVKKPKKAVKKAAKKKPTKKAVKKAVKKIVKKKILTEEQKEKLAIKEEKLTLKALKAQALSVPKQLPQSAWLVLASQSVKDSASSVAEVGRIMKESSAKYKSLSPSELESYNHIANQNRAANALAFKQWIESYTPEQVRLANVARSRLKKKDPGHNWPLLEDDRTPKQPRRAINFFTKQRYASGDLKGIGMGDNTRLIVREWAALSPNERKAFEDLAVADRQRYIQEYKTAYHREPKFIRSQKVA